MGKRRVKDIVEGYVSILDLVLWYCYFSSLIPLRLVILSMQLEDNESFLQHGRKIITAN